MSRDDRASDFEVNRFQERKQDLYKCLDEEKLEDIKYSKVKRKGDHLKHNALRDAILPLLNPVVNQLELHTAYYSCGNGEIIIDSGFKNSDDVIKKIFIVLIRVKQIVLYFFYIDLSWCRFDVSDNDHVKIIMWFETVGENKVFNYFSDSNEFKYDECDEYQIDDFDEYEVVNNGLSTKFSINDKDFFGEYEIVTKKEVPVEITRKYRPDFIKKAKRIIQSSRVFKEAEKRAILQINKGFLNYKIPKSYTQWGDLTDLMIAAVSLSVSDVENSYRDYSSLLVGFSVFSWLSNNSPLFIVKKELIDVFTKSETNTIDCSVSDSFVNELFSSFELIYPNILFLFPLDCECLYDAFFGRIDHCFVSKSTEHYSLILNKNKNDPIFSVNTITTGKFPLNIAISTKGNEYDGIDKTDNQKAPIFISRKIIAQCLLLIASKPELVITSDSIKSFSYETSGQGFQKPKYGEKVLYPRVLNLSYAEKKIRSDDNRIQRQGNHSPKSPHWRLGYEVNKPVGKMKGVPREQWERKLIKVAPYFVLGGDDKDNQTTTEA